MLKRQENFTAQLKNINENFGPVVAKSGGIFIKLYAKDPDEHMRLTRFLKEKEMQYYVIVPKWERPIKVVIRNLPRDTRPQEIKGFLEFYHDLKVDKVVQLTKLRTKRPLPLFQVTLPNEDKNKKIWNIDNVCYFKVEIQRFQRRTGALQCFNCNLHHHAAAACQLDPRCLKCGGPHSHVQCTERFETNTEGKIINPKCINCNETGHLASWRGCKKFPKTAVNNIRSIKPSRRVDPKVTYSAIARQNYDNENDDLPINDNESVDLRAPPEEVSVTVSPQQVDALKDILYVLDEFKRIFGKSDIHEIAKKLKTANNDLDRLQVLVKLLNLSV
ncbi:hypothetical protein AVEN_209480-1 [Araneus ventricosus]|uniref:CCHC-type domain-containing protein n=1 Tax=Araneus ventricosus TaxID=182803 RepID=A0A4Y2EJ32_ARAVE|nr:hypothetical protein AVEN_209480-1 [Araneus ventricosus]